MNLTITLLFTLFLVILLNIGVDRLIKQIPEDKRR